jgi:hypothetical protein
MLWIFFGEIEYGINDGSSLLKLGESLFENMTI